MYIYMYIILWQQSFSEVYFINNLRKDYFCPVGWGCRILRQHLCSGVKPTAVSVLDMTLNDLMVRLQRCWSFGEC